MENIKTDLLVILASELEFDEYEHEVGKHCSHIRKLTAELLRYLQKYDKYHLSDEDIELISQLSMLHDIGKKRVPWHIVHNPGKLTDEEFTEMKNHTLYGAELIRRYESIMDMKTFNYLVDICKYHHEKWDGNGYPCNLIGDDTPIWAQVVGIADCYDVLVSKRSYKKALSKECAVKYINEGRCGAFNPKVLEAFNEVTIYE